MRGMDIAQANNTIIARTDTPPSLWLWNSVQNKWLPLITSYSMPSAYQVAFGTNFAVGCWEARICPSLTSKFYMLYSNTMFVTTNSGGTWTQLTNFPAVTFDANSSGSSTNYKMAVDPVNDAIVFAGPPGIGLQKTSNSGVAWSTDGTVLSSSGIGIAIAFDPTSSTSGGFTHGVFACSDGNGVWHSTDGGSIWTKLSTTGMPTTFFQMICDQTGKLWVTDGSHITTWTSGSGWVVNSLSDNPGPIAVDPNNASNVATSSGQGRTYLSINGGTNWTSPEITTTVTTTGDATWTAWGPTQGWTTPGYTPPPAYGYSPGSYGISMGAFAFDNSSNLYVSHGFGVWQSTSPFANWNSAISWNSYSRGIEALDTTCILHPPGGNPIGGAWDLPIWNFPNYSLSPSTYPVYYGPSTDFNGPMPNYGVNGVRCWNIDYASGTTSYLTAMTAVGGFWSSDKGVTWALFSSSAGVNPFTNVANGGCIASSSTTNHVVMCSSTSPAYTTDNGVTWTNCTYVGNGFDNFPFDNSVFVCADRVTANKFYMYSTTDGWYVSTNSGATFTKVSSLNIATGLNRVKTVPGNAGHIFWCTGVSLNPYPQTADQLFWSTNSATTWSSALSDFNTINDFGFGTVVTGQTYPTVYLAAYRISTGIFGVYKCVNFNPATGSGTWTLMTNSDGTNYPQGWFVAICGVAGDPSVDGQCSISFINGGFKRYF